MKYYSEVTKQFYNSEEECVKAEEVLLEEKRAIEAEKLKLANERKERAAEIEQARDEYLAAREKYNTLVNNFCRDFGSYHYSIKSVDDANDLYNTFLRLF